MRRLLEVLGRVVGRGGRFLSLALHRVDAWVYGHNADPENRGRPRLDASFPPRVVAISGGDGPDRGRLPCGAAERGPGLQRDRFQWRRCDRRGGARPSAGRARGVVSDRAGPGAVRLGRRACLQLPGAVRRGAAVSLNRRSRLPRGVSGHRCRGAAPDQTPQPGAGLGELSRRDHRHNRLGAAVVGLPDGALRSRPRAPPRNEAGFDRIPPGRHPDTRGRRADGRRRGTAQRRVLHGDRRDRRRAGDRLGLRLDSAARQLPPRRGARRRLDRLLPAVGSRRAASFDDDRFGGRGTEGHAHPRADPRDRRRSAGCAGDRGRQGVGSRRIRRSRRRLRGDCPLRSRRRADDRACARERRSRRERAAHRKRGAPERAGSTLNRRDPRARARHGEWNTRAPRSAGSSATSLPTSSANDCWTTSPRRTGCF